jgi:hypothetical protein
MIMHFIRVGTMRLHVFWHNVLEILLARTVRNRESLNTPVTKYINRTKRKPTGKI